MATVWRGENTQRGRYREFMQCDFDTIGTTSALADLETVLVVHDLLAAIGLERFTIRINDRRILSGILERLGLADRSAVALRALDKLGKATPEAVGAEMAAHGIGGEAVADLLNLASLSGSPEAVLDAVVPLAGGTATGRGGIDALRALLAGCSEAGVPPGRVVIDPSIARGLDYYTGLVLESFLDDLPSLGSICSGGRYDNLAGLYTKQHLPGIGASLGIDRLLAGLEELGRLPHRETSADVFLVFFDEAHRGDYLRIAAALRRAGMAVEMAAEPKRVGQQLKVASKKGFPMAIVIGSDEFAAGTAQCKHMASQESVLIDWHGDLRVLVDAIHSQLEAIRAGH
jgi:histidyl-tRNA synthetase